VSIGVALFPHHEKTSPDLWRAANQALLEAKRPPKNRVVFYRPASPEG
jgi:GGDEF domain-containing protein